MFAPRLQILVGIYHQHLQRAAFDQFVEHGRRHDLLAHVAAHRAPGVAYEYQQIIGLDVVHASRPPRLRRILEIGRGAPHSVAKRHIQIVFVRHLLVFIEQIAPQRRLQNGNIQLVIAQWRVGVVQNHLGKHHEIIEHAFRLRRLGHQPRHRLRRQRVGNVSPRIHRERRRHMGSVRLGDKERVGEIETIPIVFVQIRRLIFGGEHRGGQGGQKHPSLLMPRRLIVGRGNVIAAPARSAAYGARGRYRHADIYQRSFHSKDILDMQKYIK